MLQVCTSQTYSLSYVHLQMTHAHGPCCSPPIAAEASREVCGPKTRFRPHTKEPPPTLPCTAIWPAQTTIPTVGAVNLSATPQYIHACTGQHLRYLSCWTCSKAILRCTAKSVQLPYRV